MTLSQSSIQTVRSSKVLYQYPGYKNKKMALAQVNIRYLLLRTVLLGASILLQDGGILPRRCFLFSATLHLLGAALLWVPSDCFCATLGVTLLRCYAPSRRMQQGVEVSTCLMILKFLSNLIERILRIWFRTLVR
jgi:hypothetical protein